MSNDNFLELPPSPSSSIAGLREIGYTVNTAVADILDNSITANAKNIWINFVWDEKDSYVSILDDGIGMDYEVLKAAMRPGSKNPNDDRDPSDLGRFSLGLKTASWSQAEKLNVWSKTKSSKINSMGWDIQQVQREDRWIVQQNLKDPKEIENLEKLESGTLIEWRNLNLVTPGKNDPNKKETKDEFYEVLNDLEDYLAMIFHRYIEGSTRFHSLNKKLNIFLNNILIYPWSPFVASSKVNTAVTPEESIQYKNSIVYIRGYVLPHKDLLSKSDFNRAGGREGWLKQQGYYVYRSDRLIVPGDWLGLGRGGKRWQDEEQYRLARLSIDISNSIDKDWSLDLKKELTIPPKLLKEKLTKLAEQVRKDARESFVKRGKYGPRPKREYYDNERLWVRSERKNKIIYKLNQKHPLIDNFRTSIGPLNDDFKIIIRIIEECIPVQQIWIDQAENEIATPFDDAGEELIPMIKKLYDVVIKSKNSEEAINFILSIEPFNRYPEQVRKILNE